MSETECPICCETYNKSTRSKIVCEYGDCKVSSCKSCIREYLLTTTQDPHCMHCKKAWSNAFTIRMLNQCWLKDKYKKHRHQLLLDRELSKLPEAMEAAQKHKMCETHQNKIKELAKEISLQQENIRKLKRQQYACNHQINLIQTGKSTTEKRKFIMPCPNQECRGYLSTAYKCDLCELHTCPKCMEIIGYSKDDEHTCNEDSVKSAEQIKKDTVPCPGCGERIFKVSGCRQMWCVLCHTAFDHVTGKIDTGTVHNPHFYEWQKNNNTHGVAPRNPGDVLCGGLCGYYSLRNKIIYPLRSELNNKSTSKYISDKDIDAIINSITHLHRAVSHITNVILHEARARVRTLGETQNLRVEYILGDISKKNMADTIYRNDRLRQKYTELLHIYELISVVGIELFNNITNDKFESFEELYNQCLKLIDEFNAVRIMTNTQLASISATYSQCVPQIMEDWSIIKKKFGIKEMKEKELYDKNKIKDDAIKETNNAIAEVMNAEQSQELNEDNNEDEDNALQFTFDENIKLSLGAN